MSAANRSITDLTDIVNSLPEEDRKRFGQIFSVTTTTGELRIPIKMEPWVRQQFGSMEAVTRQRIVKVTNRVTHEGTLFNQIRAYRPIQASGLKDVAAELQDASENDPFISPEETTPEDIFGRVTGKYSITASNIAKYDGLHGLVIFNDFNLFCFTREQIIDGINTGQEWAKEAQALEPEAKYPLFIWNCLWRAGASIYHGHAQVILTRDSHYAKIEGLRHAATSYKEKYGSNYFTDLFLAHYSVGCAIEKDGVRTLALLTPFKDNEVMLMGEELNDSFKERIHEVLSCFRDRLNVCSFNLALVTLPLAETDESWEGFPVIAWLVDRGDLNSQTSDVGGMEIYASSVVASDPLELARQLRVCLV